MEIVFSHGIDYCSNFMLLYKLQIRRTIAIAKGEHPEWTLSCSREDQPLGNIGFYCTGNVVDMFDRDCFSIRQKDGSRVPASDSEQYRCTIEEWYKSSLPTEAFVNTVVIKGLWIKKEALNYYKKNSLILNEIYKLDSLNIPIEVIE